MSGTLKTYLLTTWDPEGLHYIYFQAYMPYESLEDPVGLPLEPLGPWIGIKYQLGPFSASSSLFHIAVASQIHSHF